MAKRKKTEESELNEVEVPIEKKKTTKKASDKKVVKPKVMAKTTAKKSTTKTKKEDEQEDSSPEPIVKDEVKSTSEVVETKTNKVEEEKSEPITVKVEPVKVHAKKPVSTVRYSDEDLEEFEKNIKASKDEALDELRMLRDRLEDLTSPDMAEESMVYSMHMAEQGSEAMEKEKTFAQIQRINEYLKKLDDALLRIKDKTYGICRVCNCLINKERLLAVPITTLSASYKIHQKCPDDGIDKIEPLKEL